MNRYPEIYPMKKSLIHLNINTKKPLETENTPISNQSLKKAVPTKQKRHWQPNTIWFNPPFSRAVFTNVGKRFFQLLRHHFPPCNKLHKIFNMNTVKVSYCCNQHVATIIKAHNKKLTNTSTKK